MKSGPMKEYPIVIDRPHFHDVPASDGKPAVESGPAFMLRPNPSLGRPGYTGIDLPEGSHSHSTADGRVLLAAAKARGPGHTHDVRLRIPLPIVGASAPATEREKEQTKP